MDYMSSGSNDSGIDELKRIKGVGVAAFNLTINDIKAAVPDNQEKQFTGARSATMFADTNNAPCAVIDNTEYINESLAAVVDDAIVVIENVEYHMKHDGLNPIVAIAFVLAAVFVPVAFLGGIRRIDFDARALCSAHETA